MNEIQAQTYLLAKHIEKFVSQTHPWLPEQTVKDHSISTATNLLTGLDHATMYQLTGCLKGDAKIQYVVGDL